MKRILIVDDEESIRYLIETSLKKRGYDCVAARNAQEAREILRDKAFDLVISDVNMPGESGLDFVEYVIGAFPNTATLIVSIMDDPQVAERALDLGVYGYLIKPFDMISLQISVEGALRRLELEIAHRLQQERLEKLVDEQTEQLHRQRTEYATLVKTLPCVVYTGRKDWSVAFASDKLTEIAGYPVESFLSGLRKWKDIIVEEDLPAVRETVKQALEGDGAFVREYRIRDADGNVRWIQDRGQIILDDRGDVDHVSGVLFDITDQKRVQEELEHAKDEWERTFNAVPDLISIVDRNLRIRRVNAAFSNRFGKTAKEIVGRPCHEILYERAAVCPGCQYRKEDVSTETVEREVYNPSLDAYFHVTNSPLLNDKGERTGCVSVFRDITALKRAQEALEAAHRELDQLFSAITSVLIGLDAKGRILRWNKTAEEVFGLASKEVEGRELGELSIEWQWDRIAKALQCCQRKRKPQRLDELRYTRVDGQPGFLGLTINPVELGNGDDVGFLIMGAEITQKKLLESQLAQAQKLEAIGQLAAGIAHEINTPTQFIGDNVRFLRDAFSDLEELLGKFQALLEKARNVEELRDAVREVEEAIDDVDFEYLMEEIPQAVDQSLEGVDRVAKIVLAMKEFSHPGQEEKVATDINKAIENTITVARNEWKYVAEMVTDLDPSLPPVPCIPGELNQVFLNIIVNAAHAIKDALGHDPERKGTITVVTRHDDDYCEIRISDTGTGIPKEIQHRIFDPFFTTKEVGRGTGQGLAISYSVIVEKHQGELTFETEEGKGTTFIIRLPLEEN